MNKRFIEVLLIFVILNAILGIVLTQRKRKPNNRGISGRSYVSDGSDNSEQSIKVYPSADLKPNKAQTEYSDAGVPPNGRPDVSSQESGYNNKGNDNKGYESEPSSMEDGPGVVPVPNQDPKVYPGESVGANGCICVPYYQCEDGNIITDGSGIIDPRKIKPPEKEIPLVRPGITPSIITELYLFMKESSYQPPFCGTFHVCCSEPEKMAKKPYVHRCGIRNPSGINKRILAPKAVSESEFGEWPWQAAVLKVENGANLFQCGGVIIDHLHILTVAHCVKTFTKEYELTVRLGEWDTQITKEFLPHQDYKVVDITIHPKFREGSLWNDVAVLKLNKKIVFKPHIDSICLPNVGENFDGLDCVTTGWGKSAYRGGSYSNILKEVQLPVLSHYDCQKALGTTRLGPRFRLHSSFMCAGGEKGIDSCKGDGGGPLVCYRKDGTYSLAGLVAWGIDCGKPGIPGVYVKVSKFLDWISETTGNQIETYWPQSQ